MRLVSKSLLAVGGSILLLGLMALWDPTIWVSWQAVMLGLGMIVLGAIIEGFLNLKENSE